MGLPVAYTQSTIPALSALQELLNATAETSTPDRNLALQIAHNLRFQHGWTDLHLHALQLPKQIFHMLSGVPPERLYVHPDEQIDLLKQQKKLGKSGMPKLDSEREWVVPSHLREKWSLRRFGDIFDGISLVPTWTEACTIDFETGAIEKSADDDKAPLQNAWRTTKRILLATLDDDSTVVYYVVHDGIVKPRQN